MFLSYLAIFIAAAPLFSAAVIGLNTRTLNYRAAQVISVTSIFAAAVLSWIVFYQVCFAHQAIHIKLLPWFSSDTFKADWSIYVDSLTAVMLIVVNTVSALVHLYSVGYMADDAHKQRFMSYLSLFTFFMLVLVLADNFAQLFVGWEGVGLSSYLLIGFWFKKESAYKAAIKAFLVNRVGDIGLALGIFLIAVKFSSIEYQVVFSEVERLAHDITRIGSFEFNTITLICILLFIGCMGKSAQIGLHTWLPDAMEGPTPVSALIHAATMVTAGVFLLARASYLFEFSETALLVVTIVGSVTCLFAATIAIVQDDIKKIIAYSTCSQLGYMFFACGVSAYTAGIFHLITHAFFKALLFLSAGSVIHALCNEQNIERMGGIWKKLPYTYSLFWIGSIALVGIPPLAGFFSKDAILEAAYASNSSFGHTAYWLGIAAAVLTAFYSFRLIFLVFHGKTRLTDNVLHHIHEAPFSMMSPLIVLAIGAFFAGLAGQSFDILHYEQEFWGDSLFIAQNHDALHQMHSVANWVKILPTAAAITGIFMAYVLYIYRSAPQSNKGSISGTSILVNKWYFDTVYDFIFVKSIKALANFLWRFFDVFLIDGIPTFLTKCIAKLAKIASAIQTGYVYHYATSMIVGVMILVYWYLSW